jgi:hypothetical protein
MVCDDATRAVYYGMLESDAAKIIAWRAASPARMARPIAQVIRAWWNTTGPTAFKTTADALQYRAELSAMVATLLEIPRPVESHE